MLISKKVLKINLIVSGLRYCLILGSFGNCLGSWLKCFSIPRNRFWITFIGQSIVATSQLFVLNIPPLLAAIWFSETEISRATAIGVLGNQLGRFNYIHWQT